MKAKVTVVLVLWMSCVLFSEEVFYNQVLKVNMNIECKYGSAYPAITSLSDGGFVICWTSNNPEEYMSGIFAQRYHADGSRAGEEFRVSTNTDDNQAYPVITSLADGGYVICWLSNNGINHRIFAQRFHANGSKAGKEFQVNTSSECKPEIAISSLTNSGFVVCWQGYDTSSTKWDCCAQLFDITGKKIGDEFKVNDPDCELIGKPVIISLINDNFVICGLCYNSETYENGIFVQQYQADGIKINGGFRTSVSLIGNVKNNPTITSLTNGGYVICWSSALMDGSEYGVFVQLFNSDGSKTGEEFQVNTFKKNFRSVPIITSLTGGGFVICWPSVGPDVDGYGAYAQLFDIDGFKVGEEFKVNYCTRGYQGYFAMVPLLNGGFMIGWINSIQEWSNDRLYLKCYKADGRRVKKEFCIDRFFEYYFGPIVVSLSNGGFVICWSSPYLDRSGYGVYAKYYLSEPIIHQLDNYQLLSPANDNTIQTKRAEFSWQQPSNVRICYPWEIEYDLYLSTDEQFSNPTIYPGLQDTTFTIPKADSLQAGQTYFWRVLAKNIEGDSLWCSNTNAFFVSHTATEVEEGAQLPTGYVLEQNYPNPFNPVTSVRYALPQSGTVELSLYDITGRRVMELVNGVQSAGTHTVKIDGSDLASGVYVYTIKVGVFTQSKKMVLVR